MPTPASRYSSLAYRCLYIALACVGAIQLFFLVLEQYAIAGFRERWIAEYPIAGTYVPFAAIAAACGVFVGLIVGALAGAGAFAIAAWAGLGAEERGQSEAIARNLFEMSRLETPIIATVIGEGGSGGALALGVADRVNMLENSVYSVITVEGCAAILWKDGKSPEMRERAATALRITAPDLFELKVIDEIIPEPPGGAHADHAAAATAVQEALIRQLDDLCRLKPDKLVRRRREKYLRMGQYLE